MTLPNESHNACQCGCGRSIEGMPRGTRYTPECAPLVKAKRKRDLRRASESRVGPKTIVISGRDQSSPRKPCPFKCALCCDLPWARAVDRLDERWEPIGVSGADGVVRCRDCGGLYVPEPAPDRCSVIRSSAGMAAAHGSMHGDAKRYPNRTSRARHAP